MVALRAGELRHLVTVQTRTDTGTSPRGKPGYSWTAVAGVDVFAKIETLSGEEAEIARKLVPKASHKVTMRYRAFDTEANRLLFKGRVFNVGHAENVEEMNVALVLTCTEEKP